MNESQVPRQIAGPTQDVAPVYTAPWPAAYGAPVFESEPESEAVPASHYLWILKRHKWKIVAFVVACVICTIVISSRLTPMYEATATVDVDRQAPAAIVGQDSARVAPNDADQFLATQVKIIQSDSVLRPVAQRFHLRRTEASDDNPSNPAKAEAAPQTLKNLKVSRPPNTYLLLISYRSPNPELAADVANGIASSYIEHTYDVRFRATAGLSTYMEKQMEELKAKMERSSAALAQFEKDLSVINPEEKTSILTSRLLQLNTEYTNAQAERVRKEAALESVKSGALEAAQASSQGEQLRRLADRLDEAREKFAVVKTTYAANHPEYRKAFSQVSELEQQFNALKANIGQRVTVEYQEAVSREQMLSKAVVQTKAEFDQLNARSFEYKALKQEAESDKGLYQELVRKIKEAGINSSFQNSAIRLSDAARPAIKPVFPDLRLNAILALIFSTLLGVGAAVVSDMLDTTLRDPEQIQRSLRTELIGSLPTVKDWRGSVIPGIQNGKGNDRHLAKLGERGDASAFDEAIRTLRDSILLSDVVRRPRSLLMTSAIPREGKTTTSIHLALAHSLQGRKTLLVDADLRRPGVHGRLGLSSDVGLSAVVSEEAQWRDVLQTPAGYPDLDVLVAGRASRRAADRLGITLERVIAEAEKSYDLILVDAPPLLGFAEPLQMAAIVDGVVVIALAGQTHRNAVAGVLASLRRLKANVIGIALNEVSEGMSDRYYYYGYYGKYYSKYYKALKS